MSTCSRRYASKSLKRLDQSCASLFTPLREAQQPLLFLYPAWFRHGLFRQYHTGSSPGPGRSCQSRGSPTCRAFRNDGPIKHPHFLARAVSHQSRRAEATDDIEAELEENVSSTESNLGKNIETVSRIRKVDVPIPAPVRRVGGQRGKSSDSTAYYRRPIDADRVFSLLLAVQSVERSIDQHSSRFKVSTTIVRNIQGSSQANAWVRYNSGSGCTIVKVLPGSDSGETTIELVGSDAGQESAKEFLISGAYSELPENEIWIRETAKYRGTQMPKPPPTWTLQSFHRYVKALTHPRLRRSAMRHIYQDDQSHNLAIGQLLVGLFNNPEAASFASTRALYEALQFCRRHTELANVAVRLWDAANTLGLDISISCFNVELGRCLVVKNGYRFYDLVREMSTRGIRPNTETWALALSYAENLNTRFRILSFLKENKLLHSLYNKAKIADMIVKRDIQPYLQKNQGIFEFKEHMDASIGPGWLTSRVVTRLLRVCRLSDARTIQASDILNMLERAGTTARMLGTNGFLNLLHIATKAGNLDDAIAVATSKAGSELLLHRQQALDLLFSLAWRKQCPNLCRVLWFRAATSGRITFNMQNVVSKSLKTSTTVQRNQEPDTWLRVAGKLIVGTNLNNYGIPELFPHLFSTSHNMSSPIEALLPFTKSGKARHEQVQLSQLLIERDLSAWCFYEPIPLHSLISLLQEALARDLEWDSSRKLYLTAPKNLLAEILRIPLSARPSPIKLANANPVTGGHRQWFIANGHKLDYDTLHYGIKKAVPANAETDAEVESTISEYSNPLANLTKDKSITENSASNTQRERFVGREDNEQNHEKPEVDVHSTHHHSDSVSRASGLV